MGFMNEMISRQAEKEKVVNITTEQCDRQDQRYFSRIPSLLVHIGPWTSHFL